MTLVLGIYLIVTLAIPGEFKSPLKILGTEFKDPHLWPGLLVLALSLVLAHLCGIMARSARLARALGHEMIAIDLNATDKFQMDLVTAEEVDDQALLTKNTGWKFWLYFFARIADHFVTYVLFLGIVFGSFLSAFLQLAKLFEVSSAAPATRVCSGIGCLLLVLAGLRLLQYWLIRAQTLFDSLDAKSLRFPKKYSLTSTIGIAILLVARPLAFLLFLPFRAKALKTFENDSYPPKEGTNAWARMRLAQMGASGGRESDKELRDRIRNYTGWKKFLWSLYGTTSVHDR